MSKIDIHIIAFDVPYPANYGGVIDVFNKIKSLHQLGLKIALHLFEYGRGKQADLEEYAEEVRYYPRKNSVLNQFSSLPFIVKSRRSETLLQRLKRDEAPILFEGIHSCYYLNHPELKKRKKLVRTHNVEHHYYRALSKATKGWKKLYFQWEAYRLEQFEKQLSEADHILAISKNDEAYFKRYNVNVELCLPFHPYEVEYHSEVIKDFALYHGNLAVAENRRAVEFLIDVFSGIDFQLIVAGKKPDKDLKNKLKGLAKTQLIEGPNEQKLKQLIQSAKINCLPTFQTTGVKLKLIRALIQGNVVLVNPAMLQGTALDSFCEVATSKLDWHKKLNALFQKRVNKNDVLKRQRAVAEIFNNQASAKLLKELCAPAE